MELKPVSLNDVVYNAVSQQFEALVTIVDQGALHRYPCGIDGPITMSYRDAAEDLKRRALQLHRQNDRSCASTVRHVPRARSRALHRSADETLLQSAALSRCRAA